LQIDHNSELENAKLISLILMRLRDYKVSNSSYEEFSKALRFASQDFATPLNEPANLKSEIAKLQASSSDSAHDFLKQFDQSNKPLLLILRKFLCDLNPALDFRGSRAHETQFTPWFEFPSSYITIAGLKFLAFENKYVVAQNGGLIEIDAAKIAIEKFINAGFHIADLEFVTAAMSDFLLPESTDIDSLNLSASCPLVCLDTDYLTGLYLQNELPKFKSLMKEQNFSSYEDLYTQTATLNHPRFQQVRDRLLSLKPHIDNCLTSLFSLSKPEAEPMYFASQGGVGSGKTKLYEFAQAQTQGQLVLFSVDDARTKSCQYQLLITCAHHSDDYLYLKEFAYLLFEAANDIALASKYNYFRDSSGIPFTGKNSSTFKTFKEQGFKTFCLVAAGLLHKPAGADIDYEPIYARIITRFHKKQRAVPWPITIKKHIYHPISQCDALKDNNIDQVIVFDTTTAKGQTATLLESRDIPLALYQELSQAANKIEFLNNHKLLPFISAPNNQHEPELIAIDTIYKNDELVRIILIANKIKYIDIIKKALYNQNARGHEELTVNTFKYHIPELDFS
jgi:hypothetical protein